MPVAQTSAPPVQPLRADVGPLGEGLVVVGEQVSEFGGVERIAESILTAFPRATLVALRFAGRNGCTQDEFESRLRDRRAARNGGFATEQQIRLIGDGRSARHHYLAPLYALRIARERIDEASVVLSLGSLGVTHAVALPDGARHVGYIGGPPRAFYGFCPYYVREYRRVLRPWLRASIPAQRALYRRLVRRPGRVVTNSHSSAAAVERVSGQAAPVIYPPVRSDFFTPGGREGGPFVTVARAYSHKRIDVVLEAFRRLGEPLVVAGGGPGVERMRRVAPPNVRFAGHLRDEELRNLYRGSRGLVSASVEEFGLCVAEAQACGVPALAPRAGGSGEIVADGETGVLLDAITPDAVVDGVRRMMRAEPDPAACRRVGERFSEARFVRELSELVGAPPA